MRLRIDVEVHGIARFAPGRAGKKLGAIGHDDLDGMIAGMDIGFHGSDAFGAARRAGTSVKGCGSITQPRHDTTPRRYSAGPCRNRARTRRRVRGRPPAVDPRLSSWMWRGIVRAAVRAPVYSEPRAMSMSVVSKSDVQLDRLPAARKGSPPTQRRPRNRRQQRSIGPLIGLMPFVTRYKGRVGAARGSLDRRGDRNARRADCGAAHDRQRLRSDPRRI